MDNDVRIVRLREPGKPDPKDAAASGPEKFDIWLASAESINVDPMCGATTVRDKQPQLLVRVLDYNNKPPAQPVLSPALMITGESSPSSGANQRLIIPSDSMSPDYKILLYPHYAGARIPKTSWDKERKKLTVDFGDQVDLVTFTPTSTGRTRITIAQTGKDSTGTLVDLDTEVPALKP